MITADSLLRYHLRMESIMKFGFWMRRQLITSSYPRILISLLDMLCGDWAQKIEGRGLVLARCYEGAVPPMMSEVALTETVP
jgi:hypothetical protein